MEPMSSPAVHPHATTPAGSVPAPDWAALKARTRTIWSAGDYAVIGTTLQLVGEALAEAADVRAGERVLDVACGNGNATLAAARRFARVTGVDLVPALLDHARARAAAEGLPVELREADAEELPFEDAGFDAVLSVYGVMFTPDQSRAARELLRVCRPGGRIALACWTPDGFIGEVLRTIGRHVPPPPGLQSPARWGTRAALEALLGEGVTDLAVEERRFAFRYASAAHWIDTFRTWYGPIHKAYAALPPGEQEALTADLTGVIGRFDAGGGGGLVVPSAYLEVVATRR